MALLNEDSPFHVGGALMIALAMTKAEPRIQENFRPGYLANLTQSWIPALDGVREKRERGGKVADIGCGHGASTIIMAKAYPNSRFYGFDAHLAPLFVTWHWDAGWIHIHRAF